MTDAERAIRLTGATNEYAVQSGAALTPGAWLDPVMRDAITDGVRRCRSSGTLDSQLRETIGRCAIEARGTGVKPEQLVIAIRELWHAVAARVPPADGSKVSVAALIDVALIAYFGDSQRQILTPSDHPRAD